MRRLAAILSFVVFLLLANADQSSAGSQCSCPCRSTGRRCIRSCSGLPDGDYQSCGCCRGKEAYVSCVAGIMYKRPCPADLVWADDAKICNYTSTTCKECVIPMDARPDDPYPCDCPCSSTGSSCIRSCAGRKDGDYQSCGCCHGKAAYITCSNGRLFYRPCPANLVWADDKKICNYTSRTCRECDVSNDNFLTFNQPSAAVEPSNSPEPQEVHDVESVATDDVITDDEQENHGCPCSSTGYRCITSCSGRADGDYQWCGCCHGKAAYVSCVAGSMYKRSCPGKLLWTDDLKICNSTSKTCYECFRTLNDETGRNEEPVDRVKKLQSDAEQEQEAEENEVEAEQTEVIDEGSKADCPCPTCPCRSTGRRCVRSCRGQPDGDYQSCRCCRGYVSCVAGQLVPRKCPAGPSNTTLVWSDSIKQSNYTSSTCRECKKYDALTHKEIEAKDIGRAEASKPCYCGTCPCKNTGPTCINSCAGRPDGDYQSCNCCSAYVTCVGGRLFGDRPCPGGLVWADDNKTCNYSSRTCRECVSKQQLPQKPANPVTAACPCKSTGSRCVSSCQGQPNGDYQSCRCCHGDEAYVTCAEGRLFYRPCPYGLSWDDNQKVCAHGSDTCRECNKMSQKLQNWYELQPSRDIL